jgi:propionyl-CoA synthetase
MVAYADFHRRSIEDRDAFWSEQAKLVDWETQPQQICDYSNPPFAKWFVGGKTNLCHNAVDRQLKPIKSTPTASATCMPKCNAWQRF